MSSYDDFFVVPVKRLLYKSIMHVIKSPWLSRNLSEMMYAPI